MKGASLDLHVGLPLVNGGMSSVGDLAQELVILLGGEGSAACQVEVPVGFEGQVGLHGVGEIHVIVEQLDGDVRGVELTHVADQGVLFVELAGLTAVELHFWGVADVYSIGSPVEDHENCKA